MDTDVVAFYHRIEQIEELYIAFGAGKQFKYIPVREITRGFGAWKCRALPFFHAMSSCDTTPKFEGKGQKRAWTAWQTYPNIIGPLRST